MSVRMAGRGDTGGNTVLEAGRGAGLVMSGEVFSRVIEGTGPDCGGEG